jgi:hypothetical protein
MKIKEMGTRKTWYHGTDRLPQGGLEWCSYFGGERAVADDFISQPGRSGRIRAAWIVPARFRHPTPVLDVTDPHRRRQLLVGSDEFVELLEPYLPSPSAWASDGEHLDYDYAEAFCRARDELFPGVAGLYRGPQWGLVVVNPDDVMIYGRPFRAEARRARKATWWRLR